MKIIFSISLFIMMVLSNTFAVTGNKDLNPNSNFSEANFYHMCINKKHLSSDSEIKHTIDVLLEATHTCICHLAYERLAEIKVLDLSNKKLKDLKPFMGIHFRELKILKLNNNPELGKNGIEKISHLYYVEQLELKNTGIKSLNAISNFSNLRYLDVSDNEIENISVVSRFNHLFYLNVTNNLFTSIKAIKNLKMLEYLNLGAPNIELSNGYDISYLSHLKKLKTLILTRIKVDNLIYLSELTNLKELDLSYSLTHSENIALLSNFKKLNKLNLSNNNLVRIPFLKSLKQLTELNLEFNDIRNIDVITTNLNNLKKLGLSFNRLLSKNDIINVIKSIRSLVTVSYDGDSIELIREKGHILFKNNYQYEYLFDFSEGHYFNI